jgi:hypothetical protein
MFHGIRHINFFAIDAGSIERFIENSSGGPDEWASLYVFLIPRLFTDEHHSWIRTTFTENGLRSQFPEVTCLAVGSGCTQLRNRWLCRN